MPLLVMQRARRQEGTEGERKADAVWRVFEAGCRATLNEDVAHVSPGGNGGRVVDGVPAGRPGGVIDAACRWD